MKLKKITINNIASIENAELDFGHAPLEKAQMFLICGETGAGKSTILDAICLALYNNTPRLDAANKEIHNYGIDNISAKNPSNLLRHGAPKGSAVLEFSGQDGIDYIAGWEATRVSKGKNKGTLQTSKRYLSWTDDKGNLRTADKKDEVDKIITEFAVGLDFAQFCRTTLLAQGEFTRFLKASEDDKAQILRKLTDTDMFMRIGLKISKITGEKEKTFNTANSEIDAARSQLKTEDELLELGRSEQEYAEKELVLKNELADVDSKIAWIVKENDIKARLASLKEELERVHRITESDEYKSETEFIADWDVSTDARKNLEKVHIAESAIAGYATNAIDQKNEFIRLVKGLNELKFVVDEARAELEQTEQKLAADKPHETMFRNAAAISQLLINADEAERELEQARLGAENLKTVKMPALQEKKKSAIEAANKATGNVRSKEDEIAKAIQCRDALNPEELRARQKEIGDRLLAANKAETALLALENAIVAYEQVRQEVEDLTERGETLRENLKDKESNVKAAQESFDAAQSLYDATARSTTDWVNEMRSSLKIGDTCPVCGQKIAYLCSTEKWEGILAPIAKDLAGKKKAFAAAESLLSDAKSNVNTTSRELAKKEKLLAKSQKARDEELGKATAVLSQIGLAVENAGKDSVLKLKVEIGAIQNSCRDALAKIEEEQCKVDDANKTIQTLQLQKDVLVSSVASASDGLAKIEKMLMQTETDFKALCEKSESAGKRFFAHIDKVKHEISWNDWESEWRSNKSAFIDRLEKGASVFTQNEKHAESLKNTVAKVSQQLENIISLRTEVIKQQPDFASVRILERSKVVALQSGWTILSSDVAVLRANEVRTRHDLDEAENALKTFFETHAISRDRLDILAKTKDVTLLRKKHTDVEAEAKSVQDGLEKANKEQAEWSRGRPVGIEETATLDNLRAHKDELERDKDGVANMKHEAHAAIETDKHAREKITEKLKNVERLEADYKTWKRLYDEFGVKDGAQFNKIAQGFVLGDLLARANIHLQTLDKRYRLENIPGTLIIRLHDINQGAKAPVETLSGGESFLVSLSLALALSSSCRKSLDIDTLFIDEGFGTLGEKARAKVLQLLERLQESNGKRVGIISHVKELEESIPIHVLVKRIDENCSGIDVVDMTA